MRIESNAVVNATSKGKKKEDEDAAVEGVVYRVRSPLSPSLT